MVAQAKELAPPKSGLRAILRLQGESDAQNAEQVAAYETQLLEPILGYMEGGDFKWHGRRPILPAPYLVAMPFSHTTDPGHPGMGGGWGGG